MNSRNLAKDDDSTIEGLYDHWIEGKQTKRKAERWSIIKDVLGWVE